MRNRLDTVDPGRVGTTLRGRCSCPSSPRRPACADEKEEWKRWLRHYVRVGVTHTCPAVLQAILAWLGMPAVWCGQCVARIRDTIEWILSWNPVLRRSGFKRGEGESETPLHSIDSDTWDCLEAGGRKMSPTHRYLTVEESLSPWGEMSTDPRTGGTVDATVFSSPSPSSSPRPSASNGTFKQLVLWGPVGSQCSMCGFTLEEGQEVIMAPSCTEGIKFHTACFNVGGFELTREDGSRAFGCECGQFHPMLGTTEGIFSLRADQSTPSDSRASTPGASRASTPRASRSRRGSVTLASASSIALESCPAFQKVLPSTLAIFDGFVQMRRAPVGTYEPSMSLRDLQLDPDSLAVRFARQDVLSKSETAHLLEKATCKLSAEENLLELKGETIVVGDLHGQFFDLMKILQTYGQPPLRQYLFLGDYVDRGRFSCEVALYLLSLKVSFPSRVHMIRGNHETANQTATCGFKDECCNKYGLETYENFLECFCALPVCATLEQDGQRKNLFCMHGGISPMLKTLDEIREGLLLADLP